MSKEEKKKNKVVAADDWLNGVVLTIEHGHICLRNKFGWHVWGEKIENIPEGGYNLVTILDKAWDNELDQ